ncbi:ataxin-10-like [Atheta coriaria]|uniref:ataxin-10-like n=1 Tax=Dalotia coriaria TaxID=877792 RepID=UPI0031F37B8D
MVETMDSNKIKQIQLDNDKGKLLASLKESYILEILNNEPQSLNATIEDVELLNDIILKAHSTSNDLLLKEAIRCLRNCAIKNIDIKYQILAANSSKTQLIVIYQDILSNDKYPVALKNVLLTFLINICIGNKDNAKIIWTSLDFKVYIENKDISDKMYALAYNIFLANDELTVDLDFLIVLLQEENNEFAHFLLDLFIKNGTVFKYYDDIKDVQYRILILQQLKELQHKKEPISWTKKNVELLTSHFKKTSDCILKTVADYINKIEPFEVSLLSDVIASLSSDEQCLRFIQYDRSLLINCAFLLKSIHDAGKEGNNHFAPIGKLSKVEDMGGDIKEHPAFGFRVNMIRILGNMAWKMRCNQDEIRELDVIPLLLDCCNIDGRNPFIIQWVVFAIRNILENNIENQKIIASLNKQGALDSAVLNELGLTLHDDGPNSINIAPLNLNGNN